MTRRQHIADLTLRVPEEPALSPDGTPAWSPDGTMLAFAGFPRRRLHVVEVESGTVRQLTDGDWHAGDPAWSPDSTRLAYGAATAPDVPAAPLYVLDVTDLAAPLDRIVMPGGLAHPGAAPRLGGDGVLFCVRDRGCTHLYTVSLAGGTPRPVVAGDSAVVLHATPTSFGEVVTLDLTTGAGPLLLDIHGGPHIAWHGAADGRCPTGQAQQWHTALRENGVPTRLALYPDGPHNIIDGPPSHRMDVNRRGVDRVEQYAGDPAGPRRARVDAAHWERRLAALAAKHHVPGATLGILRVHERGDELVEAAYGVLNVDTGVETTTDSVFQIGSISKVWTTTVVMRLVDEGRLALDTPVVEVLPELRLSDEEITRQVTVRHLLTHTSGIDGDVFTDTGRGDDCLEKYVAELADVARNHPLGATWSYCNSGFSLAGRLIERLTGMTWDAALRERLLTPLGLTHTGTLPEEALLHRAAVGHVGAATPVRARTWVLPRAGGPAGLINSTVRDVLTFARLHLAGGVTADGTRVLSADSAAAMTAKHADLPDKHTLGDSWGLGWSRMNWAGRRLYGHDGNTIGQSAFLRVCPDEGLAVTLLTNGGNTRDLYQDLYREIFAELAGVALPTPPAPPEPPVSVDIAPHAGTYERAGTRVEVFAGDDGPVMKTTVTGALATLVPDTEQEYPLTPIDENLFVTREPGTRTWLPVTFYALPTGERYLHFGARATPKTH